MTQVIDRSILVIAQAIPTAFSFECSIPLNITPANMQAIMKEVNNTRISVQRNIIIILKVSIV